MSMNIERIRELCLAMPGTGEAIKYGDQLCFLVGGKHFCSSPLKTPDKINIKVPDEAFEALCERSGVIPAPYGGARYKWVQIEHFEVFTEGEWEEHLRTAYETIKARLPKKVRDNLNNPS